MASRIQPPQVPVQAPAPKREFTTPEISWEASTVGPNCSIDETRHRLFNHTSRTSKPTPTDPFKFAGTRGTVPLTAKDMVYWEIWWLIPKSGNFKPGVARLLELGAATEDAMRAATEDTSMEKINKAAITVGAVVNQDRGDYSMWGARGPVELDPSVLSANADGRDCTGVHLGFVFDGPKSYMCVTMASESTILWDSEVDVTKPLWPFVSVVSAEKTGKEAIVHIKSGSDVDMNDRKRTFLGHIAEGIVNHYKVFPYLA